MQVVVNGNNNAFSVQNGEIRIGFNGNQNNLRYDAATRMQVMFSNGVNNTHYAQQPQNVPPQQY